VFNTKVFISSNIVFNVASSMRPTLRAMIKLRSGYHPGPLSSLLRLCLDRQIADNRKTNDSVTSSKTRYAYLDFNIQAFSCRCTGVFKLVTCSLPTSCVTRLMSHASDQCRVSAKCCDLRG
jgi:hypothetical protein